MIRPTAKEKLSSEELLEILEFDDATRLKSVIEQGQWNPRSFFLDFECFPLSWAATHGKLASLRVLVARRHEQNDAAEGMLIEAVLEDDEEVVKILIEGGVAAEGIPDQYSCRKDVESPISAALMRCHLDILRILSEAGGIQNSEVEWLNDGLDVLLRSRKNGSTECLILVARELTERLKNDPEFTLKPTIMKKLADRLRKVGKKSSQHGRVQQFEAMVRGRLNETEATKEELIDLLTISQQTPVAPEQISKVMESLKGNVRNEVAGRILPYLVSHATDSQQVEWWRLVRRTVEDWGGDINSTNDLGRTSLMEACSATASEVEIEPILQLLVYQPDPNILDNEGYTALAHHLETGEPSDELVTTLRSFGAKTYDELGVAYPKYAEQDFLDYGEMPPLGELPTPA